MVQHRTNEPHRRRKIKRDLVRNLGGQVKGVAGIRCEEADSGATAGDADPVDALAQSLDRNVTLYDDVTDGTARD